MFKLSDQSYAIGLTSIYLAVGAAIALQHEMFRDELQAWLLARDSSSVIALLHNLKYDGHPGLWYTCLMLLTRITQSPQIMQFFHLLIAGTTVYLLSMYFPGTRFQKFLLAFGYFFFYEYAIICRNYALGILLFFLFCLAYRKLYERFLLCSVILFFLAHTSVFALILSIAAFCTILSDYGLKRIHSTTDIITVNKRSIYIGFGVVLLGILTSVLQLIPPIDSGYAIGWRTSFDPIYLQKSLMTIPHAFLPIPQIKISFWQSSLFNDYFGPVVTFAISFLFLAFLSIVLLRRPMAFLFYSLAIFGLITFFYVKYTGDIYHHGFLFISFIGSIFIYKYSDRIKIYEPFESFSRFFENALRPALTIILFIHFIAGGLSAAMEYRYVFSYGKEVASFIKEHKLHDMFTVVEPDYPASSIVGYLGKDQVYFLRGDRFGSFVRWDLVRTYPVSDDQIIQKVSSLVDKHDRDILLITNHELESDLVPDNDINQLAAFTGSIRADEGFYLYFVGKR
jgi:hypothetical protein